MADPLSNAATLLREARSVVVLTGAGVSAESGIRTFRDTMEGLWKEFDPAKLATPEAFAADPETVTRWYDHRRLGCLGAAPNPAHIALARIEARLAPRRSFALLTQNVDRLHQRAGSRNVVELHGTIMVWRCTRTGREVEPPPTPFEAFPPRSEAGGLLRPAVVWFGETLPAAALRAAFDAMETCDLFLTIGTSAVVYPAAGFIDEAASRGAPTIEINPTETAASDRVTISLRGKAGEVLPRLVEAAFGPGESAAC